MYYPGYILLILALCLMAALIPRMPEWLRTGMWIAAGILVLLLILAAVGALPSGVVVYR